MSADEHAETQWNGLPGAVIESETSPWITAPDGSVVSFLTSDLLLTGGGGCMEDIHFIPGVLAPMDTDEGIQRCDACNIYPGDLEAAAAVAKIYGPGFTVWFHGTNGDPGMTEHIEQTSASDRCEAARKALAAFEQAPRVPIGYETLLADALRALIAPPSVGETAEQMADRLTSSVMTYAQAEGLTERGIAMAGIRYGFNAAIRAAHETWEPEVAQRPSQEQMLRWLGISYGHRDAQSIEIPFQIIEREEA